MIHCCINPSCMTEFRFLNGGNLYALEKESENTQFFWVCSNCSRSLVLELGSDGSVSITNRARKNCVPHPPRPEGYLKLVYSQPESRSYAGECEDLASFGMDRLEPQGHRSIHARLA